MFQRPILDFVFVYSIVTFQSINEQKHKIEIKVLKLFNLRF